MQNVKGIHPFNRQNKDFFLDKSSVYKRAETTRTKPSTYIVFYIQSNLSIYPFGQRNIMYVSRQLLFLYILYYHPIDFYA